VWDEERGLLAWQRLGLASFAAASVVYRCLVTLGGAWFLYQLTRSIHLETMAVPMIMAALTLCAAFGIQRAVKAAWQRGRFAEMNRRHCFVGLALLGMATAAFFLAPLPVANIRQSGVVEFDPDAASAVYVPVPGVLLRVHVREGQAVEAGELLAEFCNVELENAYAEEQSAQEVRQVRLAALESQARAATSPAERLRAESEAALLSSEGPRAARKIDGSREIVRRLQLRAPRRGIVVGLPQPDELGQFWESTGGKPFCTIAAPDRLWVVVPLGPAQYRRLRAECAAGRPIGAAVSIPGRAVEPFAGRIARLPEAATDEVPESLTTHAGGHIPARPPAGYAVPTVSGSPQRWKPESQQFLVAVNLVGADTAIRPGTVVPVVIRCGWRSAAWWLGQTLAGTVDLALW
jgi:putative peptide zinc metalloprotease protein